MSIQKQFLAEIEKPSEQIDIELCALLFASEFQADLDIAASVLRLDKQVNDFLDEYPDFSDDAPLNAAFLTGVVGKILGYRGDNVEYYTPENSLFNKVVENRLGIPISLAAIYIAVGKRLGIDVHGVGFPGHFLIRVTEPDGSKMVIDPFAHVMMTPSQFNQMVDAATIRFGLFDDRWLDNAHPHDILLRMLENLKGVYLQLGNLPDAQVCLDYQLMLKPSEDALLRQLQAFREAIDKGDGVGPKLH